MGLSEYNKKRDFKITGEPKGKNAAAKKTKAKTLSFVIQKHDATRLHYDFRLELDGVMKSWAVTRGPSYDPADKRLAVHVEDHPVEYNKFEGVIPDKQYGAGPVIIWDKGVWLPEGDAHKDLKKGRLTFVLKGQRMHGTWHLVRMHGKPNEKRENWLLIKGDDEYVMTGKDNEKFLEIENSSIISGRTLAQVKGKPSDKKAGKTFSSKKPVASKSSALLQKTSAASTKKIEALQKKYASVELATLTKAPPSGKDWLHEIKYDGYRILAFIYEGHVLLQTRGGKDWTKKFPEIAEGFRSLKVKQAVIDGELGVPDEKGRTNFSKLQAALSDQKTEAIEGWFFDLLYLNGEDYAAKPLLKRKAQLEKILKPFKDVRFHYSAHFESAPGLLENACSIGAEGLVSKRKNGHYNGRRSKEWLKSKCGSSQEFVIGGFMPAKDDEKAVGSLLLGYYKDKKFYYAGKVGTGFDHTSSKMIYKRLMKLQAAATPFSEKVLKGRRGYVWLKPEQLCEIAFWEWTADGHIRHGSFKGLRDDKSPKLVRQETPLDLESKKKIVSKSIIRKENLPQKKVGKSVFTVEGIKITHPEREVYPGTGITKGDMAEHYGRVLPYMMPFVEQRLLSLLRCTDTIEGQCFFQRGPMKGMGEDIAGKIFTHNGNQHDYLFVKNEKGLIELVQMGTIEFHAWQSRIKKINKPDQIIFDLDPGENVPFEAIKMGAEDIRRRLKALKLESFPRLSGGKGLHIIAPIKPEHSWDSIKNFTQDVAKSMQKDTPDAYVANMSKAKRPGKIFVDYLRNDYSSTAIVPFSLRARKNAPVAVPISWKDLEKIESSSPYNISNIDQKLNKKMASFIKDFFSVEQSLKL